MLFQATNMMPSSFAGIGGDVIDATIINEFSMQINGNSAVLAYQIKIMQNDSGSTQVYSTGKQTLPTPLYPIDYKGEQQYLKVNIPASATSGLSNGEEYKWQATLWYGATDNESILCTEVLFKTRAKPTLTVNSPPSTVTSKNLSLAGTYTQTDGTPLQWFRWVLTSGTGADAITVKDTGEINSLDIKFEYDGLLNGLTYYYKLFAQSVDGVKVETDQLSFDVDYDVINISGLLDTKCLKDKTAIEISWAPIALIAGEAETENYSFDSSTPVNNHISIDIGSGNTITFDSVTGSPMDFPIETSHIWSGQILETSGVLYQYTATDSLGATYSASLGYDAGAVNFSVDGQLVFQKIVTANEYYWYIVIMYDDSIVFQTWYASGGLYPSETLYPSEDLFPMDNEWFDGGQEAI